MKNAIEFLLEDDHASLGRLLDELDTELTKPAVSRAFDLLDRFWGGLAVHIRAEHLHLFPAVTNVPTSWYTGNDGRPTSAEMRSLVERLRSDHDFFMKELALMIKTMREMVTSGSAPTARIDGLRRSLAVLRKRLEDHNHLEEQQVYRWPALVFDDVTMAELRDGLRQELQNLPGRFS